MISPKMRWFTGWASLCLISIAHTLPANDGFAARLFVPERKDDFAFENDKVAFRIYGPALKDSKENSGIACWLKRVDSPIIDKWYRGATEGKSYSGKDASWVAGCETCDQSGLGTGAVLEDASKAKTLTITSYDKDRSHVILVTPTDKSGRITYYGGFGWEKAGTITTAGDWRNYLTQFSNHNPYK